MPLIQYYHDLPYIIYIYMYIILYRYISVEMFSIFKPPLWTPSKTSPPGNPSKTTWGWEPCGARRKSVGTVEVVGLRGSPSRKLKPRWNPQKIGRGLELEFRPVEKKSCVFRFFVCFFGGVWNVGVYFLKQKKGWLKHCGIHIYVYIHDVIIAAEYIHICIHV